MSRVLFRFSAAVIVACLALSVYRSPADARARIIAVVILRSTAGARTAAVAASKALASRLAQEPGWDAVTVDARGRTPADAAASVGAEIYIIGQYFTGSPAHVSGASYRVATDERLADFSFVLDGASKIPVSVSFAQITGTASATGAALSQSSATPAPATVTIPSGDLISVEILSDIGSRISQEGDTFAVETVEDYYYKGNLILPKGSPGYGVITHLKRAGSFHAGGELNFTVKRLVTPAKTDLFVETNGATADADKVTEHNGNTFGQYLLWGVGMFAKRGNDILIKKGTTFHVSTLQNENVPVVGESAQPANLDPAFAIGNAEAGIPPANPVPTPAANPAESPAPQTQALFSPPHDWSNQHWASTSADFAAVGSWASPQKTQTIGVITQMIPTGMTPAEFVQLTLQSLRNAIGSQNVRTFRSDRICNGTQSGWYIESSVTIGATPMVAEQTIGAAGSQAYIATYRRPANSPEDSAARGALESLCPGGG